MQARQLPRSLSDDGNALVCVELVEMRQSHGEPVVDGKQRLRAESILALQAEMARLEAAAAGHRADLARLCWWLDRRPRTSRFQWAI